MGQRVTKVFPVNGEVYDHHHSTPPKPGTDMAEQHLHPCDEPPVDAGEGHAERREVEVRSEEERREEEEVEVRSEEERREEEEEVEVRSKEERREEEEEVEVRSKEKRREEVEERREEKVVEVRREEEKEEARSEEEERGEAWSQVEEEKKKRKKRFWRLPSFLRAARKRLNMICRGQTEVQLIEPSSPASSTDDDIMSRYELGDRLGVGGFGVVHEARRVEDGLRVAVKDVVKTHDMEYLTIMAVRPRVPKVSVMAASHGCPKLNNKYVLSNHLFQYSRLHQYKRSQKVPAKNSSKVPATAAQMLSLGPTGSSHACPSSARAPWLP
ncbi:hypothetical protein Q8A67_020199 [Cirrhinus molitorella]|uniref:non-specific serine/threonine protein kinase n=1 Tax=Cirrhinus molitorella TaxID=172907 RepID=A0AA88PBD8_9TELE|nr:hypothetical protein Q8A67_020199 [Cirrhinus molitorella]